MATEADRDSQTQDNPEAEVTAAPASSTPTFSLEDVGNIVSQAVEKATESVYRRNAPTPVARRAEAPTLAEPPAAPTDEEYTADPVGATAKIVARALHPLQQQMGALQAFGLERFGSITREIEGAKLPYYKDYKAEIDAEVGQLAPELQANPATLKLVHDTVVVRHIGEINERVVTERAAANRGDAPAPGSSNSRTRPATPGTPTPEELGFGPDQVDDINQRGGPDAFARRVSGGRFKDWAAFAAARQAMSATPRIGGRTVMPFARMEPRKHVAPKTA